MKRDTYIIMIHVIDFFGKCVQCECFWHAHKNAGVSCSHFPFYNFEELKHMKSVVAWNQAIGMSKIHHSTQMTLAQTHTHTENAV